MRSISLRECFVPLFVTCSSDPSAVPDDPTLSVGQDGVRVTDETSPLHSPKSNLRGFTCPYSPETETGPSPTPSLHLTPTR